jgi:hypothetical protein
MPELAKIVEEMAMIIYIHKDWWMPMDDKQILEGFKEG